MASLNVKGNYFIKTDYDFYANNTTDINHFNLEEKLNNRFELQQLRNEAHFFSLNFHRKKRLKSFIRSELDNIPGNLITKIENGIDIIRIIIVARAEGYKVLIIIFTSEGNWIPEINPLVSQ